MANDKQKKDRGEEDRVEVDFGEGKISFGGFFKGLGNLIDLAAKLKEEESKKSGEIRGLPQGMKGVYGFSIRTMAGKPVIESFGNIRDTAKGPVVEEVREPITDIFDENGHIVVIAELPGVSEDKIDVEVAGDILTISASGADRRYAKEILLPGRVVPDSKKTAYQNGILEVRFEKEK
ncbi:MAG: Hsp20/alpha crystallin family protein [Chloroflexi bacterium]|nr:Hsp20/alpha crystallin family protein [Chloroflexota bacterium]